MEIGNRIVLILALIVCALAAQEPAGIVMLFRHGAMGKYVWRTHLCRNEAAIFERSLP